MPRDGAVFFPWHAPVPAAPGILARYHQRRPISREKILDALLAGAILAITLTLVLLRPWGVGEEWWAVAGGVLALALGLVSVREAGEVLLGTRDALVLLVGMMALSVVAEEAGFFDWAAALTARAGGGSVPILYGLVFLVGTVTTATLSLDATAIVLTPIVHGVAVRLRLEPLPFVFACVYTANTASLFLPVSNLTNLLVYDALDLGFIRFGLVMLLPATLAVLANALVLLWLFRADLRGSYDDKRVFFSPENRPFFRLASIGVWGTLVAFFVASAAGVPVGIVALVAGAAVTIAARSRGWMGLGEVARSISWGVILLVSGLFVVVRGVEDAGLGALMRGAYAAVAPGDGLAQILGVAFGAALCSNLINNVPTTVLFLGSTVPLFSGGALRDAAAYATLIGTNVGPNLTTVGSLATLIWLGITRGRGVNVTARDYLRVGAVATPAILVAAAVGLWISLRVLGGG